MKLAGLFLTSLLTLLFFSSHVYAQDIVTGNQTAQTSVTNIVNNGTVTSHSETTINGETTTVDSNGTGSINIKNVNGKVTVSKSPEATIIVNYKQASITPTAAPKQAHKFFFLNIFENFKSFLKNIFKK